MSNSITSNPKSTENLLFEHFATLATAPDGIARLRELILQLAVQGMLGTQDAGDEPASILFEKISKDRKRQEKDGIIKPLNFLKNGEIHPYLIPENWKWVTIGDLFLTIRGGSTPSKNNSSFWGGSIAWASVKDLKGKYLQITIDTITKAGLEDCASRLIQPGNLIICTRMGLGKIAINTIPTSINQDLKAAELTKFVSRDYFYNFYLTQKITGTGMTVDGIRQEVLLNIPVPLPPLTEQHRIVAKVDRFMALCDELEARQNQERESCRKLGTASLAGLQNAESPEEFGRQWAQVCDAFDMILDCPENVAVLRQKILQLAVQGRLVQQESGDEPARVLLENIRKKKDQLIKDGTLQKEKPLKFANGDEVPFNIPKEWVWTYFGQITFNRDGARIPIEKAERATRHGAYDYYGASGVIDTIDDYLFDKSLLLIGEDGANLVNRSTPIAFIAHGKYWVNNHAHVLDGISLEFLRYLEIYINSIDLKPYLTGMAQPKMNQAKMNSIPVPLPPLAEQHRIVAKVDALMQLCDALESRLKERAGVQAMFADSIVKGIGVKNA